MSTLHYFSHQHRLYTMKPYLLAILMLVLGIHWSHGQHYKMAGGFRIGDSEGITIKAFLNEQQAAEFLWTFRNDGMQWTGLFEFHTPALTDRTEGFYWYYGFGPHIGYNQGVGCKGNCFVNDTVVSPDGNLIITKTINTRRQNYFSLGMNFMFGMEYRFISLPLAVGLEYKPLIEFFHRSQFNNRFGDFAISLKYTFLRN